MNQIKAVRHLILAELAHMADYLKAHQEASQAQGLHRLADDLLFEPGADAGSLQLFISSEKKSALTVPLQRFSFYQQKKDATESIALKNQKEAVACIQEILLQAGLPPSPLLAEYATELGKSRFGEESVFYSPRQWLVVLLLTVMNFIPYRFFPEEGASASLLFLFTFLVCESLVHSFNYNLILCFLLLLPASLHHQVGLLPQLYLMLGLYSLLLWEESGYRLWAGLMSGLILAGLWQIETSIAFSLFFGFGILVVIAKFLFPRFPLKNFIPILGSGLGFHWVLRHLPFLIKPTPPAFSQWTLNSLHVANALGRLLHPLQPTILLLVIGLFLFALGWFSGIHHRPIQAMILIPVLTVFLGFINSGAPAVSYPGLAPGLAAIFLCLLGRFVAPLNWRMVPWVVVPIAVYLVITEFLASPEAWRPFR